MGFGFWVLGLGISGFGFWFLVLGFGIRVLGFGLRGDEWLCLEAACSSFRRRLNGEKSGLDCLMCSICARHPPRRGASIQCGLIFGGVSRPLSSEHGTHKTLKARSWSWLLGKSPLKNELFPLCSAAVRAKKVQNDQEHSEFQCT